MKTLKHLLISLLFISMFHSIHAATITWLGGDGEWEVASNWDSGTEPDNDDIVIIPSGNVTIESYGTASNILIQNGSLNVQGSLVVGINQVGPNGDIKAIEVMSGASLSNQGLIVVYENSNIGNGYLIFNDGNLINEVNGHIYLSGTSHSGIHNYINASITNHGYIEMENVKSGVYCIPNMYNYGAMDIECTNTSVAVRSLFYNGTLASLTTNNLISVDQSGTVSNYGEINIDINANTGSAINSDGIWTNQVSSNLEILGNFSTGIYTFGTFRNKGNILIENNELYVSAIIMDGLFVNHQKGTINTQTSYGIASAGSCLNYGVWNMTSPAIGGVRSAYINSGSFNNRPKGKLLMDDLLQLSSGTTFNNQGHMFMTDINNQNGINGTFNNTGSLNDLHGNLPVINNQSIIVEPTNQPLQANVPMSNILNIGSNPGATVLAWYTTPTGSTLAGSYNSSTNTFTPNNNAIGLSSLWVRTRINTGGVTRRHEIKLSQPVQSKVHNHQDQEVADKHDQQFDINVFPNPTSDRIEVISSYNEYLNVSLIDLHGRIIIQKTSNDVSCIIELPSDIPNGTYYVIAQARKGESVKKQIRVIR